MLKTEQLRCFAATVEVGSFAAAAGRLNLSASAVAYAVDALEEQLETRLLLRRRSTGVSLTADGRRLLRLAHGLLQDLAEVENLFAPKGRALTGELTVGCQEGLSWALAPRAIEHVRRKHPGLDVKLKTIFMDQGNGPLLDADVDVLITFLVDAEPDPTVEHLHLCHPTPCAMMRRHHPLDREGAPLTLRELAQFPQIYIQDGPALELFSGLYRHQGLTPRQAMVTNISTAAQALVGTSDCVSLRIVRPAHPWSPLGDELAFAPVADPHATASLAISTLRPRHGRQSAKVKTFIASCSALIEEDTMRSHLFY